VLNERAMTVMKRMTDKLMGRDHISDGGGGSSGTAAATGGGGAGAGGGASSTAAAAAAAVASAAEQQCDSVPAQVQRLIAQAISHENLCQSYIGWCPFW
jgi:FKBP12-rapamycin complex-associated protein